MKHILTIISILISAVAFSQNDLDKDISQIINTYVDSESQPGVTVGVVQNGELIYHASKGSMNLEYGISFNDSTVFGLASITKQFTSACIGILEKQGRLSSSDTIF